MNREIPYDFILDYLLRIETEVKPFFGMTAIYCGPKLLLMLRERDNEPEMNGIWVAINKEGLEQLLQELPGLRPSPYNSKKGGAGWYVIPPDADEFETTAIRVCELIVRRDPRIGRIPKPRSPRKPKR